MQKVLFSLPPDLVARMRASIPPKQRSQVIARLLAQELEKREQALYQCALEVEADDALGEEMKDWDITVGDGLNHDSG
ncbi:MULTISPECIES: hypothetical protein [Nitrosococcus]|uniref:Uncharacterized protein n=3 Tax=Nitrosococcus TaxID=1227 RepID=Q3JF49_NITOC|nr:MULTISPECIES: hypothetical protein [Nitrosococcus]KFI17768.1 hypothetical protein IB75_18590 [Nitrosococcus oceani C-27]ABA56547.1 hypothetical protein Noc_A0034 [Nitrosococcus oceani ATCC 19707]ADJ29882.1 conserved hypothetical protein [Nitrosococcus watsonii C-113]EDZ65241.1 hypothetical protein NOC27_3405 [Nitrosococcus oceani AFC27]BBM60824.1 hypothetical protein NONS58_P0380 [Nitrosococcus oceani]